MERLQSLLQSFGHISVDIELTELLSQTKSVDRLKTLENPTKKLSVLCCMVSCVTEHT